MTRAVNGKITRNRHKKALAVTKGFRGRAKNCFRAAMQRGEKSLQYQYRDRRNRKRDFRKLWIARINAGAREHGLSYSQFIHGLKLSNIELDRKVLSELAVNEPGYFKSLTEQAKNALQNNAA